MWNREVERPNEESANQMNVRLIFGMVAAWRRVDEQSASPGTWTSLITFKGKGVPIFAYSPIFSFRFFTLLPNFLFAFFPTSKVDVGPLPPAVHILE